MYWMHSDGFCWRPFFSRFSVVFCFDFPAFCAVSTHRQDHHKLNHQSAQNSEFTTIEGAKTTTQTTWKIAIFQLSFYPIIISIIIGSFFFISSSSSFSFPVSFYIIQKWWASISLYKTDLESCATLMIIEKWFILRKIICYPKGATIGLRMNEKKNIQWSYTFFRSPTPVPVLLFRSQLNVTLINQFINLMKQFVILSRNFYAVEKKRWKDFVRVVHVFTCMFLYTTQAICFRRAFSVMKLLFVNKK